MERFPSYFKPDYNSVATLRLPNYDQVLAEAMEYRTKMSIRPSYLDENQPTVAVFGIDIQVGFCNPSASLFVDGAVEDTIRSCEFIYRNLEKISTVNFSLDTHRIYQIFHPTFWMDHNGRHPEPFTIISREDVSDGRWKPVACPVEALEYVDKLEKEGKYSLCIWPFHTMIGSLDHALMPDIFEAAMFHAIARTQPTMFEFKGEHPLTENYSVLSPEIKELNGMVVGKFNMKFFKTLMNHDRVYIMGQASSHCVKSTIEDLVAQVFSMNASLIEKVYILEDCMSPVAPIRDANGDIIVDFPSIARDAFADFSRQGIKIVRSTDPVIL